MPNRADYLGQLRNTVRAIDASPCIRGRRLASRKVQQEDQCNWDFHLSEIDAALHYYVSLYARTPGSSIRKGDAGLKSSGNGVPDIESRPVSGSEFGIMSDQRALPILWGVPHHHSCWENIRAGSTAIDHYCIITLLEGTKSTNLETRREELPTEAERPISRKNYSLGHGLTLLLQFTSPRSANQFTKQMMPSY